MNKIFITSFEEFSDWLDVNLEGECVDFYISNDTLFVNMYGLSDDTVDIIEGGIDNLELFSKKIN
tara:strand:+ start:189 stop:383 length:195 start_codon:yes stop_codon:yes gene_type:complete